MKKKKGVKDGIYFYGEAAEDVTGSMYWIKFGKTQILLECGLHQSSKNSYLDAYRVNSRKFKFNPKEIDYVFICHAHIDHSGLLPRLVKEGFKGKIILNSKTKEVLESLLPNSSMIIESEAKTLSRIKGRIYKPIYEKSDVEKTFTLMKCYDELNQVIELDENVSFEWSENAHTIDAVQLRLILNDKKRTRKIHYTSDLGSLNPVNHYVGKTKIPQKFSDIVIMESTYADKKKSKSKTRTFDLEHFKSAAETTIANRGTLICPAFSYARTQELLTCIYLLFKDDPNAPLVYVDSPLSVEICKKYEKLLDEDSLELWKKVISWKQLRLIKNPEISQTVCKARKPKIVISSSGFCTNGRIVNYLKEYINDPKSLIVFSGYVGDNPSYLSYRIRYGKSKKTIKIDKNIYANRANCMSLYTFSSHIDYNGLLEFGSNLNTNKLILVHGNQEAKEKFIPVLQERICKNNRTYKAIPSTRDMFIEL